MNNVIRGSGGGGSREPRRPTRAPDTLNSRSFVTIHDLISEGEIEGWATASKEGNIRNTRAYKNAALKDIFLDNTPVLQSGADSDNPRARDFNYQNVRFHGRFGTSDQTHIPGTEQSSSPIAGFPKECTVHNNGVTQQIARDTVDAVRVTVTFPALQKVTNNGDLLGTKVELKIQVQYHGGGFSDVVTDTVTGRTSDAYSKDYRITLDGAFPVHVKVVRITPDSTDEFLTNAFSVSAMQELVDDHETYPNTAYAAITLDSKVISNIPNRKHRIRGVRIRIPGPGAEETGTPEVDPDTGRIIYPPNYIFNNTMGAAQWCSCPAMVLLDMLTTARYGLGDQINDDSLDLFSFVDASKFANELVDDGFGSTEARFSCNINLLSAEEAFTVIEQLCGSMRCMPIWSAGKISLAIDKPTDTKYLFSLANVTEEGFSYSGSSLRTRHSVIAVSYYNMDSREIDYEIVEDSAARTKLGVVKKDVRAFGCTSRGQAQRLGKAILFAEQHESEVITFTTSVDAGVTVRPGMVIDVNDPVRSGERRSGRIKTATTTAITVDDLQDISSFGGADKKCSIQMPDNTIQTRDVISILDGVINLESALTSVPNVNAIWFLVSETIQAQKFRVLAVEEVNGINYKVTALSHRPDKYASIEEGLTLPARNISILNAPSAPPTSVLFEERTVVVNNVAIARLFVTWVPVNGVTQYLVQYRFEDGNYESVIVYGPDIQIDNSQHGLYEFQIFSFNALLETSPTSLNATFSAQGKTEVPDDVQNLTGEPVGNQLLRLRWSQSTSVDVLHGGRVYVRHSNLTDGNGSFAGSVDLVHALAGNTTEAVVPLLAGEYILKFQDDGGRFSEGETGLLISNIPDVGEELVILNKREELVNSPFAGDKLNTVYTNGALKLANLTGSVSSLSGPYSQDDTTITITSANHGLQEGQYVNFDFTVTSGSGSYSRVDTLVTINTTYSVAGVGQSLDIVFDNATSAINGQYQVNSVDTSANSFTIQLPQEEEVSYDLTYLLTPSVLNPSASFLIIPWSGHTVQPGDVLNLSFTPNEGFDAPGPDGEYTVYGAEDDVISSNAITFEVDGVQTSSGNVVVQEVVSGVNAPTSGTVTSITPAENAVNGVYAVDSVSADLNSFTITQDVSRITTGFAAMQTYAGLEGTYHFAETLDLGGVFTLTLRRHIQSTGSSLVNMVESWPNTDNVPDWDGDHANDTDCQLLVRTSMDGSTFSDDDWNIFANGEFKGQAFQFKANLSTTNINQNINVLELGYSAILAARTEQSQTTVTSSTAADGYTITFEHPFFTGTDSSGGANRFLPAISITAYDMGNNDHFSIPTVSGTGFRVKFVNGNSSTARSKQFTWQATGFGRGDVL